MVTLDNWQARMREDMQLRDFSERTRGAYELAMKLFLRWARCGSSSRTPCRAIGACSITR
jgi:hypothetical protein